MFTTILVTLVLYILFVLVIGELITLKVYGSIIDESTLEKFFMKNLLHYKEVHTFRSGIMLFGYFRDEPKEGEVTGRLNFSLPYISVNRNLLTKYHIQDLGTIPRWSRWSRILDRQVEIIRGMEKLQEVKEDAVIEAAGIFAKTDPVELHPEFVRGYTDMYRKDHPDHLISDASIVSYGENLFMQVKYQDGAMEEIPLEEYNQNLSNDLKASRAAAVTA